MNLTVSRDEYVGAPEVAEACIEVPGQLSMFAPGWERLWQKGLRGVRSSS
jgi:hypothetical protein